MSLALALQLILAILRAPGEIQKLVLLLSKSSEEKNLEIAAQVKLLMDKSSSGERPVYDSYEKP